MKEDDGRAKHVAHLDGSAASTWPARLDIDLSEVTDPGDVALEALLDLWVHECAEVSSP